MSRDQRPIDLPARPSLAWLRKKAKQELAARRKQEPGAILAEAQRDLARRHGFPSWRKLVGFVAAVSGEGPRLRQAVRSGDAAAVAALLDAEPSLVRTSDDPEGRARPSDERRMSLLHIAVAEDRREVVELLIARGADLDARNANGRTPLHDCFELARDPIAELLIAAGAEVDVCAAAAYGRHDRLRAILAADPSLANDRSTGESPLGWAAYAQDPVAAGILLAAGAIVDRAPYDDLAWGPVCMTASIDVARAILGHGADPDHQDPAGRTPLHRVLASRLVGDPTAMVELLLEAGADPDRADRAGRTPLDEAEARRGESAETYFPRRELGPKRMGEAIQLLRARSRRASG